MTASNSATDFSRRSQVQQDNQNHAQALAQLAHKTERLDVEVHDTQRLLAALQGVRIKVVAKMLRTQMKTSRIERFRAVQACRPNNLLCC